jgi:glycosyltransferase involved in cell wall biosynthesis
MYIARLSESPQLVQEMRILQIMHDGERGGILTLATMIEQDLAAHGVEIETACLFPQPSLGTAAKLRCVTAMARRILRGGFDGLMAYQATASVLVGVIGRLQGCGLRVVHQTCMPEETVYPVRLADKITGSLGFYTVNIMNSVATRDAFDGYPAAYRRSTILIEHGLDVPVAAHGRDATRQRFGLPSGQPLLLNVGRLVSQKNQHVLVRALAQLPQAHLAIAGDGPDGDALRGLAAQLGVGERLHLLGAVSSADVADLLASADIFVFPSTWETFGLAAVEAAMCGVPVIASDLPVLREVLATQTPSLARFAPMHDVDAWVAAIRHAIDARPAPDALRTFSAGLADKYSRARMIENYLRLLRPAAATPVLGGTAVRGASG